MLAALVIGFSACSDHTHDPSRPPSISRGVCHDASPTFDVSGGSVIFVKYHQVGGTTANKELIHGINWKLMKALNVTHPEGHFAVEPPNQGTGDTPIQRWVDCGLPNCSSPGRRPELDCLRDWSADEILAVNTSDIIEKVRW